MFHKAVFIAASSFLVYLFIGCVISVMERKNTGMRDKNNSKKTSHPRVNPAIYDSDYYLYGYSGNLKDYLTNLQNLPISLGRCLGYANPNPGEKVLDLGCGRGELAYHCVLKGCSVTAIDYSKDAVDLALKTRELLPEPLKDKMTIKRMDFKQLAAQEKYDVIFMADLLEHLYDWELAALLDKTKQILKPHTGRVIIHTAPNKIWVNVIFPFKRILDWPKTLKKKKAFYYNRNKYSYAPEMHVNEQTPGRVKRLLQAKGFTAKVWCDDGSSNVLSILTKKFAGADIWAVAKIE